MRNAHTGLKSYQTAQPCKVENIFNNTIAESSMKEHCVYCAHHKRCHPMNVKVVSKNKAVEQIIADGVDFICDTSVGGE